MLMSEVSDRWLSLVKEWESSGMSQAEFCKVHDIKKATFGKWRSKFIASGEVESKATKSTCFTTDTPTGFIPFKLSSSAAVSKDKSANMIELTLPYGISIRIPVDVHSK